MENVNIPARLKHNILTAQKLKGTNPEKAIELLNSMRPFDYKLVEKVLVSAPIESLIHIANAIDLENEEVRFQELAQASYILGCDIFLGYNILNDKKLAEQQLLFNKITWKLSDKETELFREFILEQFENGYREAKQDFRP